MASSTAVLAQGKAVTMTGKLVPPNTCCGPSAAALKCQLMINRDGGRGAPEATQISKPATEIPGVLPSQLPPTQRSLLLLPVKEMDSHTASFPQGPVPLQPQLSYNLITVSLSSRVCSQQDLPILSQVQGPVVQTAFLIPHAIPGLLTYWSPLAHRSWF